MAYEEFSGTIIFVKSEEEFNLIREMLQRKNIGEDKKWNFHADLFKGCGYSRCIRINHGKITYGDKSIYDPSKVITVAQAIERINVLW